MKSVAIIGGGPAGLAAGISAQCAGLEATIIAPAYGGRFIESPRVENILGFPLGVSGATYAQRAIEQAERFGVRFIEERVEKILNGDSYAAYFLGGTFEGLIEADAVVIATGMRMTDRQWHAPSAINKDAVAVVVGAGDAAIQVALGHAARGEKTVLVVRGDSLKACSPYLRSRVTQEPNITVRFNSEVQPTDAGLALFDNSDDTFSWLPAGSVEMLVGAQVDASWAGVETDAKGFILTDSQFHTSRPNVYAVGDVRAGSIKRVNVAAGEGTAVGFIIARALGVMP